MKNFLDFITTVLISSGIGVGISKWVGNICSSKIIERERQKNRRALEEIRNEFQKEINKLNSINETNTYISKVQYDKEFSIYQEIWGKLHECVISATNLYPTYEDSPVDEEEKKKNDEKKYSDFVEKFNDYSMTIEKFAPFYKEEFYYEFINIKKDCFYLGRIFKKYKFDLKYNISFRRINKDMTNDEFEKVYGTVPERIDKNKSKIQKNIREYLLSLRIVE